MNPLLSPLLLIHRSGEATIFQRTERELHPSLFLSHSLAERNPEEKDFTWQEYRMFASTIFIVLFNHWITFAAAVKIPFVSNVTFVPISGTSSLTVRNRTCDQCLCDLKSSYLILNCFPNSSCQFFVDAPRIYKLLPALNALVFFPGQVLPNSSDSCSSDTSFLLNRLNTTTSTYVNVSNPLRLILDDHGYLVTVSGANRSIFRFPSKQFDEHR